MPLRRRQYDDNDAHSLAAWAHDRLDKMEPKLDKLTKQQAMIGAGLAVIIFLSANGMLDLSKLVQPAKAEVADVQSKRPSVP